MELSIPFPKGLSSEDRNPRDSFFTHWWKTPGQDYSQVTVFNRVSDRNGNASYDPDWNPPYDVLSGILFGPEYGFF